LVTWQVLACLSSGVALAIAGLFDHYVLASALRRRGSEGPGVTQENGTVNVDTTKGNLSSHLSKLEQGGLVEIEKKFEGKTPVTYAKLTIEGKDALKDYWASVDEVRSGIRQLKPLRTT
jgi:DNA-binding transcriptional ArsR family regulator